MPGSIEQKDRKRRLKAAPALALVVLAAIFSSLPVLAETEPVQPGEGLPGFENPAGLSSGAARTQETVPDRAYADADAEVPLIQEIAEQNKDGVIGNVEKLLRGELGAINNKYLGLHQWFSDDIVSNLFANIGQLIGKWISEFIEGWVADAVQFLTAFLRVFVLNPNIAVNGQTSTWGGDGAQMDDISRYIRQGADIMYGIAVDLLLLLFILCIWKYWAEGAWRGGTNIFSATGRLIFTAGLLLAWPTIYAFEIQITNEMIKAIYFNSADQVAHLDAAMAAAVKAGLIAGAAGLAHVLAPVAGAAAGGAIGAEIGGMVLGTVGEIVSFAGLIIFLILGGILVAELIYLLVLKAIQTALITAQYMFAPVFLVFFATPDTESTCSGFVRSFVEVSLWTFVWIGLLKILVIVIYADFNPWGKILMAIGILQIMIQVPSFLAKAQISPMSDFISAGLLTGFAIKGASMLAGHASKGMMRMVNSAVNHPFALGSPQSQATTLASLPTQAANPELLNDMRAAATGAPLDGRPDTGVNAGPPRAQQAAALNQTETEEQRRARLAAEMSERERRQAELARQQQTQATGQPQAPAQPAAPPGLSQTGPVSSTLGTNTVLASALSRAGFERGIADPLTAGGSPEPLGLLGPPAGDPAGPLSLLGKEGKTTESGVFNPATTWNHAMYKFVPGRLAGIAARTYDGNSIGYSSDGRNKLIGDGRGNVSHMRARKGATPEEVAHLVHAAGLASLFQNDPEGLDAARQAAIDAGEHEPKGLSERMAAGIIGWQGGTFQQTALAKQRFTRSLFQHAALGAEDYVSGRSGNSYTAYLRNRFGDWTSDDDVWGVHMMTDSASPESPWNPNIAAAAQAISASGLPFTAENRAAASNPYVMQMPTWQRRNAIQSVARYITEIANNQYPATQDHPVHKHIRNAAIGRLGQNVSKYEVEAATAIQVESEGAHVSAKNIQSVGTLVYRGAVSDAATGYHALRLAAATISSAPRRSVVNGAATVAYADVGRAQRAVAPNDIPLPGGIGNQPAEQQWDVAFNPVTGGDPLPGFTHSTSISMPAGSAPGTAGADIRIVGGASQGRSGQGGRVDVSVIGSSSKASAPPPPSAQDARSAFKGDPFADPVAVDRAVYLLLDMHAAGFDDKQILNERVMQVAHQVASEAPQMMHTAALATRVLGPAQVSMQGVQTIQSMIESGWSPNRIQEPDVHTAQALVANGQPPTPQRVNELRLHPNFVPRPDARVIPMD